MRSAILESLPTILRRGQGRRGDAGRLVVVASAIAVGAALSALVAAGLRTSAPVVQPATADAASPATATARQHYGKLPIAFVPNRGQFGRDVVFQSRQSEAGVSFDTGGARLRLERDGRTTDLGLRFVGAGAAMPIGQGRLPGRVSYLVGKRPTWRTGLPMYRAVRYRNAWPGIDVVFRGSGSQLEYDFIVRPGASPATIRVAYAGAEGLGVDQAGNLRIETPIGAFTDHRPVTYQIVDGKRVSVASRFRLGGGGATQYGLAVGRYDRARPLVIDPGIVYAASLGGNASLDVAVDSAGAAYVLGTVDSRGGPATVGAFDTTLHSNPDAFVAKLNAAGTALEYWTYLGGSGLETDAGGIAVDAAGSAYVTGRTTSADFPTTVGAYDTSFNGNNDAFVAKLSPDGSGLLYSTFLGGSGFDIGRSVAVDGSGSAYVTGSASPSGFPTTSGALATTMNGFGDAYVAKLDPSGSGLVYATFLGGSAGLDIGRSIAVDAAGHAFVAGDTESADFPMTVGAFDTTQNGGRDAFVAELNPSGSGLVYATFLGGSGLDFADGVAINAAGEAYVTGITQSPGFPATAGTAQADGDAFITKLDASGSALSWSTFYGGPGEQFGLDIAVDSAGTAYAVGNNDGTYDVFLARFAANGILTYSNEFGGSGWDRQITDGVAAGEGGFAYVAGQTFSTNFPYSPGAFSGAPDDAFLVKVSTDSVAPTVTVSSPAPGATVNVGDAASVGFVCQDETALASCTGDVDGTPIGDGDALPTAVAGAHVLTVQALDVSGNTGSQVVTYTVVAADANGDGIVDTLQPPGCDGFGAFCDDTGNGKTTTGQIVSTGGLTVGVVDVLDPKGVRITTSGTGGPAIVSVCPAGFELDIPAGTSLVVTCGSVTVEDVSGGPALITLPGGLTSVSVPAGSSATVDTTAVGGFSITNVSGTVTLSVDGVSRTLTSGQSVTGRSWRFVGFAQPVDNGGVLNAAKAGQALPLRWRVLDASGAPVTSLTRASITAQNLACTAGTPVDDVEELAPGASNLKNLGDGNYQLNWKSPKTYANSCKALKLDIGDGVTHNALFKFR